MPVETKEVSRSILLPYINNLSVEHDIDLNLAAAMLQIALFILPAANEMRERGDDEASESMAIALHEIYMDLGKSAKFDRGKTMRIAVASVKLAFQFMENFRDGQNFLP